MLIYVNSTISGNFASQTLDSDDYLYDQQGHVFPALTSNREATFNDFHIDNVGNTLKVSTSEQLVYALEMGFNPICETGSSADLILNKAKTILKETCDDNMSNMEKAYAIYTWLIMNVQYDNLAYELSTNELLPPEEYLTAEESRYYDSWFAEGVFNNGKAVCEGFAKAFLILSKLENIPTIFVTGNGHAWNKIFVNGAWYGVDTTHGNTLNGSGKDEILTFAHFLFTDEQKTANGYTSTDHSSIVANTVYDYYDDIVLSYNEIAFDLKISSTTELNLFLSYLKANELEHDGFDYYTFECTLSPSISLSNVITQGQLKGLNIQNTYLTTISGVGDQVYIFMVSVA